MSFLEGFKNILQGKPAFGPEPSTPAGQAESIKVYIEETDSRVNGDRLETYCDIRNESAVDVLLDKIIVADVRRELDTTLKAGDRKQVLVYSGELFKHTAAHDAELHYRTPDGIYFFARHDVRYEPHDSRHAIEQLRYENTSRL